MQYRKDGRWHTVYYLYDGEGNVRQLTNSRGRIVATYNYLPFGEMMNKGEGWDRGMGITLGRLQNWGRENGLRNTITYQGREYDRDSGLYYYRARYQDPRLGRFLEVDPLLREVPEYTTGNSLPTSGNSGCGCCGNTANQNNNNNLMNVYSPTSIIFTPAYVFVNNNPINLRDPMGLSTTGACAICAAALTQDYQEIRDKISQLIKSCPTCNKFSYSICVTLKVASYIPTAFIKVGDTLSNSSCEACAGYITLAGVGVYILGPEVIGPIINAATEAAEAAGEVLSAP